MGDGTKVMFLALDAADKDVVLRLVEAGRMPNMGRLMERGRWAETVNPPGLLVGAVWPSIFTGTTPASHARYCFRQLRLGTYEIEGVTPEDVRREPFWSGLGRAGKRVAVIDVPHTHLTEGINGIHIVGWGDHNWHGEGASWPPELLGQVRQLVGRHPVGGTCDRWRHRAEEFAEFRSSLLAGVEQRVALASDLLAQEDWDLFFFVFSESHCIGHQCWHLRDTAHPRHDAAVLASLGGDPIEDVYERLDGAIGRLVELAGPDATVAVLLSHGMGPHYGGDHLLPEVLRRLDIAELPASRRHLATAVRALWGRLPMPVRKLVKSLRGNGPTMTGHGGGGTAMTMSDLRSRRCFAVPNNDLYGAVRVNLMGREPDGVVSPVELDGVLDQITEDLLALVDVKTGQKAVSRVLRTTDEYAGESIAALPDLLVEWNWSTLIESVCSPKVGTVSLAYEGSRTGDHRPAGLVLVAGPGVGRGPLGRAVPVEDLAPTLAAALGVELEGVDGRPIPEFLPAAPSTAG